MSPRWQGGRLIPGDPAERRVERVVEKFRGKPHMETYIGSCWSLDDWSYADADYAKELLQQRMKHPMVVVPLLGVNRWWLIRFPRMLEDPMGRRFNREIPMREKAIVPGVHYHWLIFGHPRMRGLSKFHPWGDDLSSRR